MNIKKSLSCLFLCVALTVAATTNNLIKNADFREQSSARLPLDWQLRGPATAVKINDSIITLTPETDRDNLYLIQYGLPLQPGKSYRISFSVQSRNNNAYRLYCEYAFIEQGSKQLRSSGGGWIKAPTAWQQRSFRFDFPAFGDKPYLVLNVKGPAEVQFRELKIQEFVTPLLRNADFRDLNNQGSPLEWILSGRSSGFVFQDGTATLKGDGNDNLLLIQSGKALPGNTRYCLTFEVKSPTGGDYRVYAEYKHTVSGNTRFKSFSSAFRPAPKEWTAQQVDFELPEAYDGLAIVLNVKGKVTAEFRNLRLTRLGNVEDSQTDSNTKSDKNASFGTRWQFALGSASTSSGVKVVSPPADKVPAATCFGFRFRKGESYCIEYAVIGEGDPGDDTGFYFYTMEMNFPGNNQSISSQPEDTWSTSFQRKRFTFTALADSGILIIRPKTKGAISFKEFTIRHISDSPEEIAKIILDCPYYRNNIYASQPVDKITGIVYCERPATLSAIRLDGKKNDFRRGGKISPDGRNFRFEIGTDGLVEGEYRLTAELKTTDGKKLAIGENLNKLPSCTPAVLVGKNKHLYLDGQPFFPVVMWFITDFDNDATLYYAARNGINATIVAAPDAATLKRKLDRAHRFGIKLIVRTQTPADASESAYRTWLHHLETLFPPEIRRHPAFLAYFLKDEPFWVGYPVAILKRCYQQLKNFDPFHPVWINAAPRGTIAEQSPYAECCDIYGVDIYPVPQPNNHSHLEDKNISCVGKYARRKAEITGNRKPIWMALQGFAWDSFKGNDTRKPYPTATETRFMVYDSLINGANSVGWWGTQYVLTPAFYNILFKASSELHKLSGALLADSSSGNNIHAGIQYRTYAGNNWRMMIAANPSPEFRQVWLQDKAFIANELKVLEEKRTVAIKNGKWQDTFAPYSVHIYLQGELPSPNYQLPVVNLRLEPDSHNNPFALACIKQKNAKPYTGTAKWIWEKAQLSTPGGKAVLRRDFKAGKPINKVVLLVAADDAAEVSVNGKWVGRSGTWDFMTRIDLSCIITQGDNVITIEASDCGALPCGVIAELNITYTDGTAETIISDEKWQARAPSSTTWNPAAIAAEYGSGAWGRRVRFPNIK